MGLSSGSVCGWVLSVYYYIYYIYRYQGPEGKNLVVAKKVEIGLCEERVRARFALMGREGP
jgi:hypothetical protein